MTLHGGREVQDAGRLGGRDLADAMAEDRRSARGRAARARRWWRPGSRRSAAARRWSCRSSLGRGRRSFIVAASDQPDRAWNSASTASNRCRNAALLAIGGAAHADPLAAVARIDEGDGPSRPTAVPLDHLGAASAPVSREGAQQGRQARRGPRAARSSRSGSRSRWWLAEAAQALARPRPVEARPHRRRASRPARRGCGPTASARRAACAIGSAARAGASARTTWALVPPNP